MRTPQLRDIPFSCGVLIWWAGLDLNQRCFLRHGFTDRCNRQLCTPTHVAESAELESDTISGTIRLANGPRTFRAHSPYMAGAAGFEPTMPVSETGALPLGDAPIGWQGQSDLNTQHAVLETAALPVELCPYIGDASGDRTRNFQLERLAS